MKTPPAGKSLFWGALAVLAMACWLDCRSALAGLLRGPGPVAGLVIARHPGQGRVIPPDIYIPLYVPAARRLEIVSVHYSSPLPGSRDTLADVYSRAYYASSGDVRKAGLAMAAEAMRILSSEPSWPPDTPAPAYRLELLLPPEASARSLGAWRSDPLFWPRLPARLASLRGISRYDAFLLAWTLYRLDPRRVGLSLLPAPKLIPAFLAGALGRLAPAPPPQPTAEILNASGSAGIALRATKILRLRGIDVVHFGNARRKEPATRVIDRAGVPADTKTALDALDCPGAEVQTEMERDPRASMTVILGQDFAACSGLKD